MTFLRSLACSFALSLFAFPVAMAAFIYPPNLESPRSQALYAVEMIRQYPWIDKGGGGFPLDPVIVIQNQQKAMDRLKQSPEFQELAAHRPSPKTLYVDVVQSEPGKAKILNPETAENWKIQLARIVAEEKAPDGEARPEGFPEIFKGRLRVKIQASVSALATRNPRSIIVGLTQALPGPDKAAVFKAASVREQYDLLAANPNLTTEALKRSFKAQAFQLSPDEISRENLLALVEKNLRAEDELHLDLMLAFVISHMAPEDLAALLQDPAPMLAPLSGPDLDYAEAPKDRQLAFQDFIFGKDRNAAKIDLIEKLAKAQLQGHYSEVEQVVPVVKKSFIVKEASPALAQFRGRTASCCSTLYAAQYALSPQEFVYLIYSPGEPTPLGYLGIASVLTDGKKTAYVHDFGGGANLVKDDGEAIIHAYYKALKQLGFERITFGALHGNNQLLNQVLKDGIQRAREIFPHQYLDGGVRQLIAAIPNNTGAYDTIANAVNVTGNVFTPLETWLEKVRVEVADQAPEKAIVESAYTPEENFLLLVNLLYNDIGNARRALFSGDPEIVPVQQLVEWLKNNDKLPLAEYYARIKTAFEEKGIRVTSRFLRDNEALFWRGHMRAADALSTPDESLRNDTIKAAIQLLKAERDAEVSAFVGANREAFGQSERFQKYVAGFSPQDPAAPQMMHQLLEAGVSLDALRNEPEKLLAFASTGNYMQVRAWAASLLPDDQLDRLDATAVGSIAGALNQGSYATERAEQLLRRLGDRTEKLRAFIKQGALAPILLAWAAAHLPTDDIAGLPDVSVVQILTALHGQKSAYAVENVMRVLEVIKRDSARVRTLAANPHALAKSWATAHLPPDEIAKISDADVIAIASSLANLPNSTAAGWALHALSIVAEDRARVARMALDANAYVKLWVASHSSPETLAKMDPVSVWNIASLLQQNSAKPVDLMILDVLSHTANTGHLYEVHIRSVLTHKRTVEKDPDIRFRTGLVLHPMLQKEYESILADLKAGLREVESPAYLRHRAENILRCDNILNGTSPMDDL